MVKAFFSHWFVQLILAILAIGLIFQVTELVSALLEKGVDKLRSKEESPAPTEPTA